MKLQTQRQMIIGMLRLNKEVTRNECLKIYVSRLGAIIDRLEKDGWKFNAHYRDTSYGKDYVYELISEPPLSKYQIAHNKFQQTGDIKQLTL